MWAILGDVGARMLARPGQEGVFQALGASATGAKAFDKLGDISKATKKQLKALKKEDIALKEADLKTEILYKQLEQTEDAAKADVANTLATLQAAALKVQEGKKLKSTDIENIGTFVNSITKLNTPDDRRQRATKVFLETLKISGGDYNKAARAATKDLGDHALGKKPPPPGGNVDDILDNIMGS